MRTPLQKDEKILLVTHRTWLALAGPALFALIAITIGIVIGFIIHFGWALCLLGIAVFIFKYYSWQSYIWVVTNQRVIDEIGLFSHFAKESPLEKINNVSYSHSFWGRMFNYGDVEIQTAAQIGATVYKQVSHPKQLKEVITQAQTDIEYERGQRQANQFAAALGSGNRVSSPGIASEIEKLYQLKIQGVLSEEEYQRAKNKLLQ